MCYNPVELVKLQMIANKIFTAKSWNSLILSGMAILLAICLFLLLNHLVETSRNEVTGSVTSRTESQEVCTDTFRSERVELAFEYDKCAWSLEEKLDYYKEGDSVILALHETGSTLAISSSPVGMGGGYLKCLPGSEPTYLSNGIVRLSVAGMEVVLYLNQRSNYGIKDQPGANGDEKFNSLIEDYDENAYSVSDGLENTVCWQESMNLVNIKEANNDDFTSLRELLIYVSYPDLVNDDPAFFADADDLAVTIFSTLD